MCFIFSAILAVGHPWGTNNTLCSAPSAGWWWMSFICHIHNYTEYNEEWNVFSAFNPSKCTHLEQWAADCAAPREQSWTSCRSRDSNPQPWVTSGFKSNTLSIRPTTAERGDKRHIRGCLRGGPAGVRLGAPPLSAWLIRRTSEALNPRRSWPGSLALWEEVASCWAWALSCRPLRGGWRWFGCLLSQVQVWGDCKQLEVSVASLEMTSEPPGSIPQSPPQLVPTGCLTKPERRGRELCPPLTSPPSWARGGTIILPGWTTNA